MSAFSTNEILDRLKRIKGYKGHGSDTQLADFLGISRQAISNWRKRDSLDFLVLLKKLSDREFIEAVYKPKQIVDKAGDERIPFLDWHRQDSPEMIESSRYLVVPDIPTTNRWAIRVEAENLRPKIMKGDILVIKEIDPEQALEKLPYIWFTEQGTSIYHYSEHQGKVRLWGNPEFPDYYPETIHRCFMIETQIIPRYREIDWKQTHEAQDRMMEKMEDLFKRFGLGDGDEKKSQERER